jgi:hypothetical protein
VTPLRRLAGRIIWPQLLVQTALVATLTLVLGALAWGCVRS